MIAIQKLPRIFAALLITLLSAGGCKFLSSESSTSMGAAGKPTVWLARNLQFEGANINVGYCAEKLAPGQWLEPVVHIAKDGEAVADAMVFCRFISPDGQTTLGDEAATVYEAASDGKLGVYRRGKLTLPEGEGSVAVRFRIILPDLDKEWTKDVVLPPASSSSSR